MKYIIMCGGSYENWETPRQLYEINGEKVVERTIRLLKEQGEDDIAISSDNEAFANFGVPLLKHENNFKVLSEGGKVVGFRGWWVEAFYPTDEPVTYLFGDVVYSPEAIRIIRETETEGVEFFASAPPYDERYFKPYQEPFAFKANDPAILKHGIKDCITNAQNKMFWRHPIAWELWTSINHGVLKKRRDVYRDKYTPIRDYTCDIDTKDDALRFEKILKE